MKIIRSATIYRCSAVWRFATSAMAKIIRVPTACRVTARALALPHASFVTLKMYNLPGNEVATLVSEKLGAGKHQRMWEAGKLTSGVYQHRLQAGELMRTKKLILLGKSAWPVALFSPEPKITTKVQRQEVYRPFLVSGGPGDLRILRIFCTSLTMKTLTHLGKTSRHADLAPVLDILA